MSDIKCPICQNNLHKINIVVSTCKNDKCKLWGSSIPNLVLEALTKTNQDLERTRKALGVALDWLREVATPAKCDDDLCREFTERKLAEIKTILEQKGVK